MAEPVGSPLWWLNRLGRALDQRNKDVEAARNWYSGNHPISEPPPNTLAAYDGEAREAFDRMSKLAVTNFLGSVVDVKARKLQIEGFHFGDGPDSADTEAWDIWTRNELDSESDRLIETALSTGQGFGLVWVDGSGERAEITLEDPSQTIVAYEPGSRRRAAGLKRWIDSTGYRFATVYLPDGIYKFRSRQVVDSSMLSDGEPIPQLVLPAGMSQWVEREAPIRNPLGRVPLVELPANAPLLRPAFGGGVPEFQGQIIDQQRINQTVLDMLITMEHQAFRQRWVIGWKPPIDPKTGEVDKQAALKASAAALMVFGNENTKVGEFQQADFRPFIDAIERDVKKIASTSGTPPYAFLLGDMINVAADSLARIEGQLTDMIYGHQRQFRRGVHELVSLGLAVEGNPRAADTSLRPVWAEPEHPTASEQVDVARALRELGAPDEAVFAAMPGVDQQQAARWARQRRADALTADEEPDVTLEAV